MADGSAEREILLREEYARQMAAIPWHELQTYFAHGSVIAVAATLDLLEVAVQLGMDNTTSFTRWIELGEIAPVSDVQAQAWYDSDATLWAVVSAPWVLVQQRPE
jgi:hypothetical protein